QPPARSTPAAGHHGGTDPAGHHHAGPGVPEAGSDRSARYSDDAGADRRPTPLRHGHRGHSARIGGPRSSRAHVPHPVSTAENRDGGAALAPPIRAVRRGSSGPAFSLPRNA